MSDAGVVGREEELSRLLAVVEDRDRLPSTAVVHGEAGIGKTTLWLATAAAAAAAGYRVLRTRPSEAEARFSFVGLSDLLDGVVDEILPVLSPPQARALEAALLRAEPDAAAEERVVAAGLLGVLRELARQGPVLVAVDDVQWLDAASLSALRFALARLAAEPVAALLAYRGELPEWIRRADRDDRLVAVEVGPLSLAAVHQLLRERLDVALPRPVLVRIWETSRGNPLHAVELARALERRGGAIEPGAELPIAAGLDALLRERLGALSRDARGALAAVAALADPTLDVVERAAPAGAAAGIAEALDARVLELDGHRLRFTHPLLASAIGARTPPSARRELHRQLAAVVAGEEERARHLALAVAEPDEAVAAMLDGSVRGAVRRGVLTAAAELAEQALRLTPPGAAEDVRRRLLEAADRHFEAGDIERALARLEDARLTELAGAARAAVLLRIARGKAETTGATEAVPLLRRALDEAGDDVERVAMIRLELAELVRFDEGPAGALAHAAAAVEAAARVRDAALNCRALASYGLHHFNAGRGIAGEAMQRAVALERGLAEPTPPVVATPSLVHQLFWSGDLERARERLDRWRAWLAKREDPDAASEEWYRALLEWRVGSWQAAARAAAAALALTEQYGRDASTMSAWPAAVIAAHRGDLATARERATRIMATPSAREVSTAAAEWVLGFADLSEDAPRAALPRLERAAQTCFDLGFRDPGMHWFMPDLLDALVAVGAVERAEELLAPWRARAQTLDRPWALAVAARTGALAAAARGDLDSALAGVTDARAEHGRAVDPFQLARTLLAQGATQRRAKQRRAARATLERALAGFERLGAPLWAAKAQAELERVGGRAPSRGDLTPSERRIATLVAEGRTNREVAAAVFVTEQTVEAALTRVYRKLGLRSRAELAARLAARD